MKTLLNLLTSALFAASSAIAAPPAWGHDLSTALRQAAKENKLSLILVGRESCGNCQAAKRFINEGKVGVTAEAFVLAEIDTDNAKVWDEFERKFPKEKFGDTLPFVVIADAKGKPLASYSGPKSAGQLSGFIEAAQRKAAAGK